MINFFLIIGLIKPTFLKIKNNNIDFIEYSKTHGTLELIVILITLLIFKNFFNTTYYPGEMIDYINWILVFIFVQWSLDIVIAKLFKLRYNYIDSINKLIQTIPFTLVSLMAQ